VDATTRQGTGELSTPVESPTASTAGTDAPLSNAQLLTVAESLWTTRLQVAFPELPHVAFVLDRGARQGSRKLGHWWAKTWTPRHATSNDPEEPRPALGEVFLASEHLADGAEEVLNTLLHEAAHALAFARGVVDTPDGRYHNRRFRDHATEVGLIAIRPPQNPRYGWCVTALAPGTAEAYAAELRALDTAIRGWRKLPPRQPAPARKKRRRRNHVALECGCIIDPLRVWVRPGQRHRALRCDTCGLLLTECSR